MSVLTDHRPTTPIGSVEDAASLRRRTRRRTLLQPGRLLRLLVKAFFSALIVFLALFPLAWMIISGFKIRTEVVSTPFQFFPEVWQWENYAQILSDSAFLRTLAITGGGAVVFTAGSIAVNSMAAYAFARLEFAGKKFVWPLVLMTMFIPGMTILLTSFIVVTNLRMLDTLAVLIIPGMAAAGHIFFVRQFYLNIPSSLEEAAVMDGCGRWGGVPPRLPPALEGTVRRRGDHELHGLLEQLRLAGHDHHEPGALPGPAVSGPRSAASAPRSSVC
jgi:multiple sugar transport system permease protein